MCVSTAILLCVSFAPAIHYSEYRSDLNWQRAFVRIHFILNGWTMSAFPPSLGLVFPADTANWVHRETAVRTVLIEEVEAEYKST